MWMKCREMWRERSVGRGVGGSYCGVAGGRDDGTELLRRVKFPKLGTGPARVQGGGAMFGTVGGGLRRSGPVWSGGPSRGLWGQPLGVWL